MVHRYFDKRHPAVELFLDIMLVVTLLIAVVNQFQLRDEVHARQDAAYNNCLSSNDARQVVVNILAASEKLVNAAPGLTQEQKKSSDKFYESQIKKIKFSDCAAFKAN